MNDKIKTAFDGVCADEELKNKTYLYVIHKMSEKKTFRYKVNLNIIAPVCTLCILLFLFSGVYNFVFRTTSIISIDVNPSVELEINRLDRVIAIKGMNSDGSMLASELDVKYLTYTDALAKVIGSQIVEESMNNDGILCISVVGLDEKQGNEILEYARECRGERKNFYCYSLSEQEAEDAHSLGLSCGRYRAYEMLQKSGKGVNASDLQNMTMREIWDMLEEYNIDSERENQNSLGEREKGHGKHKGQKFE